MAIRIEYGPNASLLGSVAQSTGLGRYYEQQKDKARQDAKEAADQLLRGAQFMAQQQQRAVDNQHRAMQARDDAAMRGAQFQLGIADRAAAWDERQQGRQDRLGQREEDREWDRERLGLSQDFQRENWERMNQQAEAQRQHQADMLEAREAARREYYKGKGTHQEQQEINKIEGQIAGIRSQMQSGQFMGPAAQAKMAELQGRRDHMLGLIGNRTAEQEKLQEFDSDKHIASRTKVIDGNKYWLDGKGELAPYPKTTEQEHRYKMEQSKLDLRGKMVLEFMKEQGAGDNRKPGMSAQQASKAADDALAMMDGKAPPSGETDPRDALQRWWQGGAQQQQPPAGGPAAPQQFQDAIAEVAAKAGPDAAEEVALLLQDGSPAAKKRVLEIIKAIKARG